MSAKEVAVEVEELLQWLNGFTFSRSKKNLSRDFSDGVLLAELLKSYYPNLVDLHNYSPANKFFNKMENWKTLDKKVLSQIGLALPRHKYEEIANCEKGKIEKYLLKCKKVILEDIARKSNYVVPLTELYPFVGTQIPEKIIVKLGQQNMLPITEYSKLYQNYVNAKSEIATLQTKLKHLESMIHLKEERIQDLSDEIQALTRQDKQQSMKRSILNTIMQQFGS